MKIAVIMGTRPEIIKLAPIIYRLNKKSCSIIFTGQHYDYKMSIKFIDELGVRSPDYKMRLTKLQNTTTDRATQLSEIIFNLAKIITTIDPDTVIVQGDTNTALASAITAIKCNIPVCHVEAGLRSYDWIMPEEHNRIAVDHISEFLFAPTITNQKILQEEKVHGRIFTTGNTSIDAINDNNKKIEKMKKISIKTNDFALVTLHRGENVDNRTTLSSIIKALLQSKTNMIFPIHPRTEKRLQQFGFYNKVKNSKNISLVSAVGYFDILYLMKKCKFIISDSGGIQEEATSPKIRKKVIVIRKSTERIEAVKSGFSEVVGTSTSKILASIKKNENIGPILKKCPYGNGNASKKIIRILQRNF